MKLIQELHSVLPAAIKNSLQDLDARHAQLGQLEGETLDKYLQKVRFDWNFHSNAIEGNSLSYGETKTFLMYGITAKGKPLKDHLDIRGHNEAINFLYDFVKSNRSLTEADLRGLHQMLLVEPYEAKFLGADGRAYARKIKLGTYKESNNHVKTITGEIHYYASWESVPALMADFVETFNQFLFDDKKVHPLISIALLHHQFVHIHPFDDGNGRMVRLLTNLFLIKQHFPPLIIRQEKKEREHYYSILSQADGGQYDALLEFFLEKGEEAVELKRKALVGESLDEPGDFDKKLELFKRSFPDSDIKKEKVSSRGKQLLIDDVLAPFFIKVETNLNKISTFFFDHYVKLNNWKKRSFTKTHWDVTDHNYNTFRFYFDRFKSGKAFSFGVEIRIIFNDFSWELDYNYYLSDALSEESENPAPKILLQGYYGDHLDLEVLNIQAEFLANETLDLIMGLSDGSRPTLDEVFNPIGFSNINKSISKVDYDSIYLDYHKLKTDQVYEDRELKDFYNYFHQLADYLGFTVHLKK